MGKRGIDCAEYEIWIDHMTPSEAAIAATARRVHNETKSILYGEAWGKLKTFLQAPEWPEDAGEIRDLLLPLWKTFFSEEIPSFEDDEGFIAYQVIVRVIKKIAKHIIDAVYEVETDGD